MARATDSTYERRLSSLVNAREPGVLQNGLKGVERESLRVLPDGSIAHTPHPAALGSALASEHITTDFSESLIELVTPPFSRSWELLQYLTDLHQFVYRHLGDELLWATSMPCRLTGDADVPTAFYGPSNVGRMKSIYREGLRNRYGALMQAISGVHFNYSFPAQFWDVYATVRELRGHRPDFQSASYFDLLRNYRRHGWIVLYLFGVSPAVGSSFLEGDNSGLVPLDAETLHGPYATSLRMSDIGYRNRNQAAISVSVNSLNDYLRDLRHAIQTPHPPYQQTGSAAPAIAGCSSTPTCCRSRTSTTATSVPSAWRDPARAPARHCGAAASNTSRCARSIAAPSIRWASTRSSCDSSRRSPRSACCATAHPLIRPSRTRWTTTTCRWRGAAANRDLMLHRAGRPTPLSRVGNGDPRRHGRHLRTARPGRSGAPLCRGIAGAARESHRRGPHALGAHAA